MSRLDFSGPNPVRGAATWRLALPGAGHVSIRMFDLLGRTRRTLFEGTCAAGVAEVNLGDGEGQSLVRGVYFVEVRAGTQRITRPVVVLH